MFSAISSVTMWTFDSFAILVAKIVFFSRTSRRAAYLYIAIQSEILVWLLISIIKTLNEILAHFTKAIALFVYYVIYFGSPDMEDLLHLE